MIDQSYQEHVTRNSNIINDILHCDKKDGSGLNDFQQLPTDIAVRIPKVGINEYRLPINVKNKFGETRGHDAVASMYVSLDAQKNGVSMSRLCRILQEMAMEDAVNLNFFKTILNRYKSELVDDPVKDVIDDAFIKLKFNYAVKQKSLKSDNWGWQYYPVAISAKLNSQNQFDFMIELTYQYSSTCPCSLSMAKQYEQEFASGKNTEGSGVGVPHSQRSKMTCKIKLSEKVESYYIEDLLYLLKQAIPTETQSLVKRVDEQAFAILNGTHPMFVEHASKRIYSVLNEQEDLKDWIVELEHIESLHNHNAAAVIYKGIAGGFTADKIF